MTASKDKKHLFPLILSLSVILMFAISFLGCSKVDDKDVKLEDSSSQDNVDREEPTDGTSPIKHEAAFVGSQACKSCHKESYDKWHGSHHQLSMALASKETVRGDFNNVSFEHRGIKSKLFMKDGKYYANTRGPDGKYTDFEIKYTFGITPLQQYMIEFPDGKIQCLHIAWDDVKKQWYHLYPELDIDHKEWLHWGRGGQNWNSMCADCHSTRLLKNYDPETDSYRTTFKEINVSCESCHGPGEDHIALVSGKTEDQIADIVDLKVVMNARDDSKKQVDQCARCHSRRRQITSTYKHDEKFLDQYVPSILFDNIYHPGGQIDDEVYVYGSFVQSKMYHKGVKCTSCHEPHTLKPKFTGNALCTQCHVKDKFDTPKHHFHKEGTDAAKCVNCHMAGKHYMGIDFRRDHSFRIPRPDLSAKFGSPNACKNCHDDKTNSWAAEAIFKHTGKPPKENYADLLSDGRSRNVNSISSLLKLITDQEEPGIARATAVWLLSEALALHRSPIIQQQSVSMIANALYDDDPLVRLTTLAAMKTMNQQRPIISAEQQLQLMKRLLKDEYRAVRAEAANTLIDVPEHLFDEETRADFDKALKEFEQGLKMNADFPSGQRMIGQHHLRLKDYDKAIDAYKRSIDKDGYQNTSRMELAYLYYTRKMYKEAEMMYRKVIEMEPAYERSYYSLGLMLSELKRMDEAIEVFKKGARKGNNPRIYYNWGLALHQQQKIKEAENAYKEGLTRFPNDESLMYIISLLYFQNERYIEAEAILDKLLQQNQRHRDARALMEQVQLKK